MYDQPPSKIPESHAHTKLLSPALDWDPIPLQQGLSLLVHRLVFALLPCVDVATLATFAAWGLKKNNTDCQCLKFAVHTNNIMSMNIDDSGGAYDNCGHCYDNQRSERRKKRGKERMRRRREGK